MNMTLLRFWLAVFSGGLFLFSPSASAFVDVHLLPSYGSTEYDDAKAADNIKLKGPAMAAALHLHPIPLFPLGIGVGATAPTFVGKGSAGQSFKLSGLTGDVELMAWSPVTLFHFTPYAKLGYVQGAYKTGEPGSLSFKSSGHLIAFGFDYSLVPLVALLLELDNHSEELKSENTDVAAAAGAGETKVKLTSTYLRLGLRVGL